MTKDHVSTPREKRFSRSRLQKVKQAQTIPIVDRALGPYPAAPIQEMFWFLSQVQDSGSAYVVRAAFSITGTLNVAALAQSFQALANRHEVLRSQFELQAGKLVVTHRSSDGAFPLDHKILPTQNAVNAAMAAQIQSPMDMQNGPLSQAHLWSIDADTHVLLVRLHHAIADDATIDILWQELSQFYAALSTEQPIPNLDPTAAFLDFDQNRTDAGSKAKDRTFWHEKLRDCPPLSSPADSDRPKVFDHTGAQHQFEFGSRRTLQIAEFSAQHQVTPFAIGLAAWGLFLRQQSGQSDVVTAVPISHRDRPELAKTIGPLLNTVALRFNHGPVQDGAAFVRFVQEQFLEISDYAATPINQIIEWLDPMRSAAHHPLFQTMFSWVTRAEQRPITLADLPAFPLNVGQSTAQVDLALDIVADKHGGLSGAFEYATSLFTPERIATFTDTYLSILDQLVNTDNQTFSLPEHAIARRSLPPSRDPLIDVLVPDRITAQAARAPQAAAIIDGDYTINYDLLEKRANVLAHHLIERGVTPASRVAICLPKSADCFIAALAIWKVGAAYVPIDPETPSERLEFILEDCQACALIASSQSTLLMTARNIVSVAMDSLPSSPQTLSPKIDINADHAAYIIYTSGSSGTPKGVEVSHRALAAMTLAWGQKLELDADHVFLQMANFSFDVAIADLCRTLCFGGTLALCRKPQLLDVNQLVALIRKHGVTAGDFTPAVLDALTIANSDLGHVFDGFRLILCGSDVWPRDAAHRLLDQVPQDCMVMHAYGLTETVVDALLQPLSKNDCGAKTLPLGCLFVPGSLVQITGPDGQPVTGFETGEIWIGGPCLARGYINRDDLNTSAFVQTDNGRLFRTRDLGRFNAAGQVEFLGRADKQIKIRGYRIEPQEIENRLRQLGALQALVVKRENQLIGYVTGITDTGKLRDLLANQVPDYMVPTLLIEIDSLPLTKNGKIDESALPAPDFETGHRAASDDATRQLAAIWKDMLNAERIGLNDNFFERGGHSMLAVRMAMAASEALNCPVDATLIFAHPTLEQFARAIAVNRDKAQTHLLKKRLRTTTLPATAGQESLWFLAQDPNQNVAYNMPFGLRLSPQVDHDLLAQALQAMIDRHESLRMGFVSVEGQPNLEISDFIQLPITRISITEDQLTTAAERESRTAFDLSLAPLVRVTLAQVADGDDVLFVTFHHIIADGWSLDLFVQELQSMYRALSRGGEAQLPPLALQFGDYAEWQNSQFDPTQKKAQLEFWLKTLKRAPSLLTLPTDFPRPTQQNFAGARCPASIDPTRSAAIQKMAQSCGTTSFVVVLAAWQYLMSRLSGQEDIVTGVPDANRNLPDTRAIFGYFVNTLAIHSSPPEAETPLDLVRAVKSSLADAQANKDVPFAKVVEHLNPQRSPSHSPIFQTMLAWETAPPTEKDHTLALFAEFEMPSNNAKYDLLLEISENDDGIAGSLQFATALFTTETAARILSYLDHILDSFVAAPNAPLANVSLLDPVAAKHAEQALQPVHVDISPADRILNRFAAIAKKFPENCACVYGDHQTSYATLQMASTGFARHLLQSGLQQNQRVAIWADRTPEMIIAVLGVLRAGGCVVPIDPRHPAARIHSILQDASPFGLFATDPDEARHRGIDPFWLRPITWDEMAEDTNDLPPFSDPAQPCYILYTSGTTGTPKGVIQSHAMLDNLINWQLDQPGKPRHVLQFASLAFDVAFQEIFSTLCAGATLVLMPMEAHQDVVNLGKFLQEHQIERAFLPAAVLHALQGHKDHPQTDTKCEIITAGEALKLTNTLRNILAELGVTRICNQYGPSETHVVSQHVIDLTTMACSSVDAPIGTPISNTSLYVLDTGLNPVPTGVVGELFIGGVGVAHGYLGRADLSAERFINDPYSTRLGAKMFKSGDLVRRDASGVLHFLGRIDDQVKIRGYRVEPREVETLLSQQSGVRDAAVVIQTSPAGHPALVAYCVYQAPIETLKKKLGATLPEYMCPQEYVLLDRLPLNTSGKVDRKSLPEPDWQSERPFTPPATLTETALCALWSETLGVARIGALDDFFENGGHSLLAARILHQINRKFKCDLSLSALLSHPILRDLAQKIDKIACNGRQQEIPQISTDTANRYAAFPLTDIQQAYLVGREQSLSLGGVSAHSYTEFRIQNFDVERFQSALNTVISRHDMLRATFQQDGSQIIHAEVPSYQIAVHQVTDPSDAAVATALDRQREHLSHQVLDAEVWPLFGFEVTALPDEIYHLHISLDALIIDAASTSLLMAELFAFYANPAADLPEPKVTFRDYVIADQAVRSSDNFKRAQDYWLNKFDELPVGPDLPLACQPNDIEKPVFHRQDHCIEQPQWDLIKQNASKHKITASGMLLAAFNKVLNRYAQNSEFSLSLPLFNRQPLHPDINAVIGDFSSVLLFQTQRDDKNNFADYARAVQSALWQDMDHSQVSGIEVMRRLGRRFGLQPQGLPVVFNSTLTEMDTPTTPRGTNRTLKATNVHTITQTPQVWLDHTIVEENGALFFNWDSIDGLFPAGMINAMFTDYCALVKQLAQPEIWSGTSQPSFEVFPLVPKLAPISPSLLELVAQQAERTPDRQAVITPTRSLSYADLMAEAETLAACLQRDGLQPGDRVAILMPVGWEQTVGVLGCLLAGGVYVPIDPDFPRERIDTLLSRTDASAVVTSPALRERLAKDITASVLEVLPNPTRQNARSVHRSDTDLAYIIFTSGSTGEPKGVMIDHGGAVNTVQDINRRINLQPEDRILGVSALNFDLSVYDIFGPLSVGAALVLPDADARRDPAHWRSLIRKHGVTIWNAVPALTGLLVEDHSATDAPLPLRCAMMSGDWIPLSLPDALRGAAPQIAIWSLGGATEASIWSIGYRIERIDPAWNSIPYGTALDGQSIHILDDKLRVRPVNVAGEIYIGGRGLALGYWDDPTRTNAAFVVHPQTGDRLYRTGDLGKLMPSGDVEFLGRSDSQVKVQGYRIELGGIEKALERHSAIQAAAVRIIGDTMAQKRLVAYVVRSKSTVTETDLRTHLAAILPSYEIPSSFTWLDALPLSANGKVDRSKLPDPQDSAGPSEAQFMLRDAVEHNIADIVAKTLDQQDIPAQGNLLSLGANSLDIVRISNAVAAAHGFRPPLAQFMRTPTVAELITLWRNNETSSQPLKDAKARDPSRPTIEVIEDEAARTAFKAAQKGIRHMGGLRSQLPLTRIDDEMDRFESNRSTREFSTTPVGLAQLADMLSALMQNPNPGRPRFQYSSAGGLYPVQTYVFIKPGRVDGIVAGSYYLHPQERTLINIDTEVVLDGDSFDYFVNRPTFDAAAFAVFFVADMAAIEPIYGSSSHNMVLLETGQMAQHLTNRAGDVGLGLCGIGALEKDATSALFNLTQTHQLIYSMLGGIPATTSINDETEEFEI